VSTATHPDPVLLAYAAEALDKASRYIQDNAPYDSILIDGEDMDGWALAQYLEDRAMDLRSIRIRMEQAAKGAA
jgi:hypothetical protein